jgi:hypothetical protein
MHVPAKGRPPKLSLEDQVLLCLSYWREYRFTDYTHRHSLEVHELFANSYADESKLIFCIAIKNEIV